MAAVSEIMEEQAVRRDGSAVLAEKLLDVGDGWVDGDLAGAAEGGFVELGKSAF
jgi:hypothetical protein